MMAQVDHTPGQVQGTGTPLTGQEYKYEIKMLESCEKAYRKLVKKNGTLQRWVETYLEELMTNPYLGDKLHANFPGCRSLHFLGNAYRIIYKIVDEPLPQIVVLEIGHRSSSYSDLARVLGLGK